jgi:hypothetical protein
MIAGVHPPAVTPVRTSRVACGSLPPHTAEVFAYAVRDVAPNATLVVRSARVVCGGPDDFHLDPIGAKRTAPLAPGVKIRLLAQGSRGPELRPATLAQLTQLFAHTHDFRFESYFTGQFRIHTNGHGRVTAITELYHP